MDAWKPGDDCSHLDKNGTGWRWGGGVVEKWKEWIDIGEANFKIFS